MDRVEHARLGVKLLTVDGLPEGDAFEGGGVAVDVDDQALFIGFVDGQLLLVLDVLDLAGLPVENLVLDGFQQVVVGSGLGVLDLGRSEKTILNLVQWVSKIMRYLDSEWSKIGQIAVWQP